MHLLSSRVERVEEEKKIVDALQQNEYPSSLYTSTHAVKCNDGCLFEFVMLCIC